jgi:hypothetical protein
MPTADLTTAKVLFNSTISTPGALFYGIDLTNFYLNTPMECYEYMHLRMDIFTQEIINKYNHTKVVDTNGWVYVEIQKEKYGLPQAGILANKLLKKCLAIRGYYQCQHMPGLWRHMWRDMQNGCSVLLAVCSAICPASFGRILPFCMGQNILANEWFFYAIHL